MKIRIKSEGQNLRLWLPTCLIFSRTVARLGGKYGLQYAGAAMKDIPPEAVEALFTELRRIKRKYKSWELVKVEGADGSIVDITL